MKDQILVSIALFILCLFLFYPKSSQNDKKAVEYNVRKMESETGWIVKWIAPTGKTGQSEKPMSLETARAWCEQGNKDYPEIKHFIEYIGGKHEHP